MNEKALRTLEYHKIIDLLVRHANCEAAKQRCKKLTPMTSLADIETAQRQTADALSRIFKKGSLSFLGVHDVTASMKRLEIGAALSIEELLAQTKLATKVAASALAAEQAETEATLSRPAFLSAKGLTPAERGTALHNFMQFADFSAASKDPEAELKRLIEQSYLTEAQANAVDLTRVEKFFTGPLGQRVLHADRVYKEQRFIVSIPAGLTDKTLSGEDAAQPMILQGAVDCMFEENGSLYILDFKTDRCYNKQELWERYGPQLTLYKEAMTRVMNNEVKDTVLYSFYMNAPVYAPGKE